MRSKIKIADGESLLKTTLYSIGDAVMSLDLKGRVIMMNPVAEKLTGWKESSARGKEVKKVFNIINEKTRKAAKNPVSRVIKEGVVVGLANHTVLVSKNGTERPIGDSAAPIFDKEGKIAGVVLIFRDLTKEKELTERIEMSEVRYRRLFETAQDGILLVEFDTGKILDVNPFLLDILGFSKTAFLNKYLWEIGSFKDIAKSRKNFQTLRKKEYIRYEDIPLRIKGGKEIEVEFVSNVYLVNSHKIIQCNIRNIADRRLLERELTKLKEKQFQALIENLPQKVFLKDRDCVYLACNENYAKDMGIEPKNIAGKTDYDFFPKEIAKKYRADDKRIMASGGTEELEEIYVQNGNEKFVRTVKASFKDEKGEPMGLIGLFSDITERKKMENAMRESEEKFRNIFDNAGDGILIADIETKKFIIGNSSICRMLGYRPEEIPTLGVMDIHPEKDIHYVLGQFRHQANEDFALARELPVKRRDGSVFYADVNATKVQIAGKKYLMGFFHDTTEHRRANEEHEKILAWQREVVLLKTALLASAPLEEKLKSITEGIVRIFNADFCRIWLISAGDLCAKGCVHAAVTEGPHVCRYRDKCLHLVSSSGRYTHLDGKNHRRVPFDCYKIGRVASGKDHKFLTNDVLNDPRVHDREWARKLELKSFAGYQLKIPGGEVLGVLALFAKQPISPLEDALLDGCSNATAFVVQNSRLEEEKLRVSKLNIAADIKSKFTSMVSHELRSPMGAIKEGINLVLDGSMGGLSDKQKEVLAIAKTNTDRLGRLINNVLDFQKMEAGKMEFDIQENDINETVLEVKKTMGLLADEKGLALALDVSKGSLKAKFDKDKILQVLTNLISNALKFTEKGEVTILARKENDMVHVMVRDSGPGVKKEDLERIFLPFEQLDSRRDKKKGGSGLGLAITKDIIEAHHGKIWAESEVGKGTTFHFTLPTE